MYVCVNQILIIRATFPAFVSYLGQMTINNLNFFYLLIYFILIFDNTLLGVKYVRNCFVGLF